MRVETPVETVIEDVVEMTEADTTNKVVVDKNSSGDVNFGSDGKIDFS